MLPTSFVAVNKFQIIWGKVAFKKPSRREKTNFLSNVRVGIEQ